MTRKEKIAEAARKYATHPTDTDVTGFHGKWVKETKYNHDEYLAFLEGSQWADENPKSPWISVQDDLPSFHSDLVENAIATKNVIVLLNDGRIRETQLFCGHWKEYDKKVTHWMPIPELPKE